VSLKTVQTDQAPAAIGPYSQGVIANGLLFTAGQIGLDPATGQVVSGGVVAQTERVLANLKAILDSAGATWRDVVKTTVYLHDMNDFPVVNETYARLLGDARPARSTVQVSALPRNVLVEIDAVVKVPVLQGER
jgi:2-iminobutanoate/2-iminopropanoate deaminase